MSVIHMCFTETMGVYVCMHACVFVRSVGPGWCALQRARALSREVGVGFEPVCEQEGAAFSALQCDQADCWCVSEDSGLELPDTRTPRRTGQTPSCDRKDACTHACT